MQVKDYPKAARDYSITELEICGLAINIASFVHVDADAIVDHLVVKVDFLWNRTVDSLKTSLHPLLWTSLGLKG